MLIVPHKDIAAGCKYAKGCTICSAYLSYFGFPPNRPCRGDLDVWDSSERGPENWGHEKGRVRKGEEMNAMSCGQLGISPAKIFWGKEGETKRQTTMKGNEAPCISGSNS